MSKKLCVCGGEVVGGWWNKKHSVKFTDDTQHEREKERNGKDSQQKRISSTLWGLGDRITRSGSLMFYMLAHNEAEKMFLLLWLPFAVILSSICQDSENFEDCGKRILGNANWVHSSFSNWNDSRQIIGLLSLFFFIYNSPIIPLHLISSSSAWYSWSILSQKSIFSAGIIVRPIWVAVSLKFIVVATSGLIIRHLS